jgi:hypothetical protein
MPREVRRLTAENRADFFRLHSEEHDAGWCFCVAVGADLGRLG